MSVHMTQSNEIQAPFAGRLMEMLAPRPQSTFMFQAADHPGTIFVVDRGVPPSEGRKAVIATERGFRIATLDARFRPSSVWGVVTWILRKPS
jgi:hypothetical protein